MPTIVEAEIRRDEWARLNGLKRAQRDDITLLIKKPYKKPKDRYEINGPAYGLDHLSLWNKDDKPFCFISQPYVLDESSLVRMREVAEKYGLQFSVSWNSWYFPGRTLFIEWRSKDNDSGPKIPTVGEGEKTKKSEPPHFSVKSDGRRTIKYEHAYAVTDRGVELAVCYVKGDADKICKALNGEPR